MTADRPAVVIIGAGGHAKVVVDMLQDNADFNLVGCVSQTANSTGLLGLPSMGNDEALPRIMASGVRHAFVAVGDNRLRAELMRHVAQLGFSLVNAVSRRAVISARVALGAGIAIMAGAVINVDSVVEDGVIINTGATVDHDCRIGACAHIAPGTHLAGNVTIGEGTFLGVGCSVIPGRTIGAWSTIGAGSAVVRDIPGRVVAVGVPATILKRLDTTP